ncbi:hypothetical protein BCR34DRAFT_547461 [Clohesyomyces aquaticus]|uniref:Uncharacterized protein n=1 Tax=Clohesyomyces aquaticus TaxID=1231657 RepID=A0A1Y1YNY6_9PLEO|nr:hypothetical protein BCR34DRAFT_547461 [Clohesyomyces aquaticus]
MPPPRLLRLRRPCHLPRSLLQTRWASNGPRDTYSTRLGDSPKAGRRRRLQVSTAEYKAADPSATTNQPDQLFNPSWGAVIEETFKTSLNLLPKWISSKGEAEPQAESAANAVAKSLPTVQKATPKRFEGNSKPEKQVRKPAGPPKSRPHPVAKSEDALKTPKSRSDPQEEGRPEASSLPTRLGSDSATPQPSAKPINQDGYRAQEYLQALPTHTPSVEKKALSVPIKSKVSSQPVQQKNRHVLPLSLMEHDIYAALEPPRKVVLLQKATPAYPAQPNPSPRPSQSDVAPQRAENLIRKHPTGKGPPILHKPSEIYKTWKKVGVVVPSWTTKEKLEHRAVAEAQEHMKKKEPARQAKPQAAEGESPDVNPELTRKVESMMKAELPPKTTASDTLENKSVSSEVPKPALLEAALTSSLPSSLPSSDKDIPRPARTAEIGDKQHKEKEILGQRKLRQRQNKKSEIEELREELAAIRRLLEAQVDATASVNQPIPASPPAAFIPNVHTANSQSSSSSSTVPPPNPNTEKYEESRARDSIELERGADVRSERQRLVRTLHTHSRQPGQLRQARKEDKSLSNENTSSANLKPGMDKKSTTAIQPTDLPPLGSIKKPDVTLNHGAKDEASEQSLFAELFPEVSSYIQPDHPATTQTEKSYPKLQLPADEEKLVRRKFSNEPPSPRQRMITNLQARGEDTTVLQLLHCSTELDESDFRRLIPKGRHIQGWVRDGEFYKIIPGRDPLTLERFPFYYLLFRSPESALAYQNNVARLHKLAGLHQPTSIFSAIPPPRGFLEDGEDIDVALSSYLLKPASLKLSLNMVLQPYKPELRTLIEQGGYKPIVSTNTMDAENGNGTPKKVFKVLLWITGYEPLVMNLYHVFVREAYDRGITWPFHREHLGVRRLRDVVDLPNRVRHSTPNANSNSDALSDSGMVQEEDQNLSQMVMGRLYNRWIIEFEERDAAIRFARVWDRKVLPNRMKHPTWRDTEEVRVCGTEFLW